jgi:hypothetical protein
MAILLKVLPDAPGDLATLASRMTDATGRKPKA